MRIRIGTRASKLALWQAYYVQERLQQAGAETEIVALETKGDKILDVTLSKIGSKGVFTEELEEKLLNGEIEIAVHSAKDVQSELDDSLEIIAFTEREKPNDVLVSDKPVDLSLPLVLGTSSVRRVAFLKRYYPHIKTVNVRGNLQTRIQKMRDGLCDALHLAYAGVSRMEYKELLAHEFPTDELIPPVGQGTIAIEASKNLQKEVRDMVRQACNDLETEQCLIAERAFLSTMKGGCSIPVFGYAVKRDQQVSLKAGIISLDGGEQILVEKEGGDSLKLGKDAAEEVLGLGGRRILDEIKNSK